MSEVAEVSSDPDTIIVKINCEAIKSCWRCFPISKKYWSFSVYSDVDVKESKKWFCHECEDLYPEKILWIKVKILRSDLETIKNEFKKDGYVLIPKNKENWFNGELSLECEEDLE